MRIIIEILPGCDKCGDAEYLQPDECLCDKCLIKGIKKDLQDLDSRNYSQGLADTLREKYQKRLLQITQR